MYIYIYIISITVMKTTTMLWLAPAHVSVAHAVGWLGKKPSLEVAADLWSWSVYMAVSLGVI